MTDRPLDEPPRDPLASLGPRYTLAPRGPRPGDGFAIRAAGATTDWAIASDEPWPEIRDRPWPDGLRGMPWLPWLFGHGRTTPAARTAIRSTVDGRAVLRLHRRRPIFRETIGVFDARDERIGYCRGEFKTALGAAFDLVGVDHRVLATVRAARVATSDASPGETVAETHRVASPDGRAWGTLAIERDSVGNSVACVAAESNASRLDGPEPTFFLAAAVVIAQFAVERSL